MEDCEVSPQGVAFLCIQGFDAGDDGAGVLQDLLHLAPDHLLQPVSP